MQVMTRGGYQPTPQQMQGYRDHWTAIENRPQGAPMPQYSPYGGGYGQMGYQAYGNYGMFPQQMNQGYRSYFMPQQSYYNPGYGMGFLGGGSYNNRNYLNPQSAMYRSPSSYGYSQRSQRQGGAFSRSSYLPQQNPYSMSAFG